MIRELFASKTAREIAALFRDEPLNWAHDGVHYVRHSSGLSVWVANRDYGLEVTSSAFGRMYGGVTFASSFGLDFDRVTIWRAYLKWRAAGVRSILRSAA